MVIIIGAGPIGLATGIELKKRNIPFMIIERGCLVQSLYNYPVNMTFFSTSDKLEIGGIPFISHGFKPTRSEALEYYRRAAQHYDLPIQLYETVNGVSGENGRYNVRTTKGDYEASKIVIATGFYGTPNKMGIPGEDLPKVQHYYRVLPLRNLIMRMHILLLCVLLLLLLMLLHSLLRLFIIMVLLLLRLLFRLMCSCDCCCG